MTARFVFWTALALAGAFFVWLFAAPPIRAAEPTCGKVSWYGTESGSRTADGSHFDGTSMTAAMPSRKHLGERYRVTWRGRSVTVTINDYGPAAHLGRGMDLSRAAFAKLANPDVGVIKACWTRLR